jgi:hypothetical protein
VGMVKFMFVMKIIDTSPPPVITLSNLFFSHFTLKWTQWMAFEKNANVRIKLDKMLTD